MCQNKIKTEVKMVSYRKRGNVWQYEISYKDNLGKYKKLRKSGFKLKSEAIQAASKIQFNHPKIYGYQRSQQHLSVYFDNWIRLYKLNKVSDITYIKYQNTSKHIKDLFGNLRLCDLTKDNYQERINIYAKSHSKRTVSCLHKQIRACLLDALDENIIQSDPTRKTVITGKEYHSAKKFLNYDEWKKLITHLNSNDPAEMMIYVSAMTGMRYSEVAGLTKSKIDLVNGWLNIDNTWDYKYGTGFKKTKNSSSIRKIATDQHTNQMLKEYLSNHPIPENEPIFMINQKIMVSAQINKILTNKLNSLSLPRITFHGLRHTHASILLYKGVSVLSVSKRLGHSNITTTQSTYLHIIKELENQDQEKILKILDNNQK
jgi:integrase